MILLHASCVAIGDRALLIMGPSGAGKSDLALRLIDRGAVLVSDDQVSVETSGGVLLARAPATIAGKIEVRGLGILAMASAGPTQLGLIVDLSSQVDRMPEPKGRDIDGVTLPVIVLDPFEFSAPIKAELALLNLGGTR